MDKEIKLPPRIGGEAISIPEGAARLVIIGANGAGKTRFTRYIMSELGQRAFRLSALRALYSHEDSKGEYGSIDKLFATSSRQSEIMYAGSTELERLVALLMHDEMLNLISYKVNLVEHPKARLKTTRLDRVIALWREIFPDNQMLIESGRLLFARGFDDDVYSMLKLSAGERTVLYYIGALLYAPTNGVVFIESPEMFLHPSVMQTLWNRLEQLRPDCTMVYTTHDLEFASSRTDSAAIWVRHFDPKVMAWDYDLLPPQSVLSEELYMTIMGSRKNVLFIEGDGVHSIDAKLYPLVFEEYTVKSLGSCNKVIESTRAFNDLTAFHHMDSYGIVDRDRRDEKEVEYLRRKKVMVPDVAEIENILMLEEVIRTVAHRYGRNEDTAFGHVKKSVLAMFKHDLRQQALQHTRHRVKRLVEYRVDGRFSNIGMFEQHINELAEELNPRGLYEGFCREFRQYVDMGDYQSVLRVYNQKSMLPGSGVANVCGLAGGKDEYIKAVLAILRENGRDADRIRRAVKRCFGLKPKPEVKSVSAHGVEKK